MYNRDANSISLQEYIESSDVDVMHFTVTSAIFDEYPDVQKIWIKDVHDYATDDRDGVGIVLEVDRGEYAEDIVYMTKEDKRRLYKVYSGFVADLDFTVKDGETWLKVMSDRDL